MEEKGQIEAQSVHESRNNFQLDKNHITDIGIEPRAFQPEGKYVTPEEGPTYVPQRKTILST